MDMTETFQRARSDEQRAIRSEAILDTAASMLEEMPVADISLNELSRRVGLAKSNVLRYFDSREGVLLVLMERRTREWLGDLEEKLPTSVDGDAEVELRAAQLADAIAGSLARRPVLCDLISSQSSVLERNVSAETIAEHKLTGLREAELLSALIQGALPELGPSESWDYVMAVFLITSSLWVHSRPPAALRDAMAADGRLAAMRLDFAATMADFLTTFALGLHARAAG